MLCDMESCRLFFLAIRGESQPLTISSGGLPRPILFVHGINSDAGTWKTSPAPKNICREPRFAQAIPSIVQRGGAAAEYKLEVTYEFSCQNNSITGATQVYRKLVKPQTVKTSAYIPTGTFNLSFIPLVVEAQSKNTFVFRGKSDTPASGCGYGDPCYDLSYTLVNPSFMGEVTAIEQSPFIPLEYYPVESNRVESYKTGGIPDYIATQYGMSRDYDVDQPDAGINHNGIEFYTSKYSDQTDIQQVCNNPTIGFSTFKNVYRPGTTGDWYLTAHYRFSCSNIDENNMPVQFEREFRQLVRTSGYINSTAFKLNFDPFETVIYDPSTKAFTFRGWSGAGPCSYGSVCFDKEAVLARADFQDDVDAIVSSSSYVFGLQEVDLSKAGTSDKFARIDEAETSFNKILNKWERGQTLQLKDRLTEVLNEYYGDSWKNDITKQVDLVVHSQGGLIARNLTRVNSQADLNNPVNHIRTLITLNTPHVGTAIATDHSGIEVMDEIRKLVTQEVSQYLGPYTISFVPGSNDLKVKFDPLEELRVKLDNFMATDTFLAYPSGVGAAPTVDHPCASTLAVNRSPSLIRLVGPEYRLLVDVTVTCTEGEQSVTRSKQFQQTVRTSGFIPTGTFDLDFDPLAVEYQPSTDSYVFKGYSDFPPGCGFGDVCYDKTSTLTGSTIQNDIRNFLEDPSTLIIPGVPAPRSDFTTILRNQGQPVNAFTNTPVPLTAFYGVVPNMAHHLATDARKSALGFCNSFGGILASIASEIVIGPARIAGVPTNCPDAVNFLYDRAESVIYRVDRDWSVKSDFIVDQFSQQGVGVFDQESKYFSTRGYASSPNNYVPHMDLLGFEGATSSYGADIFQALLYPPGLTQTVGLAGAFDNPLYWTSQATLTRENDAHTEGQAALRVGGSGYREIVSTSVSDLVSTQVTSKLGVDVLIPAQPQNPWWMGDVQLFISSPSANVFNAYIGRVDLNQFSRGSFAHLFFDLPADIQTLLRGSSTDISLKFALNGDGDFVLDNLRFYEDMPPAILPTDNTAKVLGFEDAGFWSSNSTTLVLNSGSFSQGSSSLGFSPTGYTEITSANLNTAYTGGFSQTVTFDLMIPVSQPNPSWIGAVQLYLDSPSAGVYNAYLGQQDLMSLTRGIFQTIRFDLPADIQTLLGSQVNRDFKLKIVLNVPANTSPFALDNLEFVAP